MTREQFDAWFVAHGFIRGGNRWCIAWSCRDGYDFTDLEFIPLGQGWDVVVGHHASGTNPRLFIGHCDSLADIERIYHAIRLTNGFNRPDPDESVT